MCADLGVCSRVGGDAIVNRGRRHRPETGEEIAVAVEIEYLEIDTIGADRDLDQVAAPPDDSRVLQRHAIVDLAAHPKDRETAIRAPIPGGIDRLPIRT